MMENHSNREIVQAIRTKHELILLQYLVKKETDLAQQRKAVHENLNMRGEMRTRIRERKTKT